MGAVMWFWIFYRAREDGPALLVRDRDSGVVGRALAARPLSRVLTIACCMLRRGASRLVAGPPAPVGPPRPRPRRPPRASRGGARARPPRGGGGPRTSKAGADALSDGSGGEDARATD